MWPIRIIKTRYHHNHNHNQNHNNNNNKNDHPKSPRTPPNPEFNHQSFKDIESLFDLNPTTTTTTNLDQQPSSSSSASSSSSPNFSSSGGDVKRRSVFHRVHLANRVSRAFSARPKPNEAEILTSEKEKVDRSSSYVKNNDDHKTISIVKSPSTYSSPAPAPAPSPAPPPAPALDPDPLQQHPRIGIPGAEKRVVVYVTSLRVVRSTFEACRTVRSILQGFRVPIDERDLTMDASFFEEIRKIMAQIGQNVDLPRVFIGGRYIGGADEVVELHEIGELKKLVKGLPAATAGVCDFCGGFRFVLCLECNGSHKCHVEDGGFRTCTVCNENGLIRCPSCLST